MSSYVFQWTHHCWVMQCILSVALLWPHLQQLWGRRKPQYFQACFLSLWSVHPCQCNLTARAVTQDPGLFALAPRWAFIYIFLWPELPIQSSCSYLCRPVPWVPSHITDTAVGFSLCGLTQTSCTQIIHPTGRMITIRNVLAALQCWWNHIF